MRSVRHGRCSAPAVSPGPTLETPGPANSPPVPSRQLARVPVVHSSCLLSLISLNNCISPQPGRPRPARLGDLRLADFDHLEVFLAHAAIGTNPVFGHIFPAGSRGNAVIRPSLCLIVNQSADYALPFLHRFILLLSAASPARYGLKQQHILTCASHTSSPQPLIQGGNCRTSVPAIQP